MCAHPSAPIWTHLTPDDIVRELNHLPSAPKVLPRLKQLLSDCNSSMHEIVELIRLDLGIAARVLQVGNSAYYSKGVRCAVVDEAVRRVGYDQVYELVAYAVASQVLARPVDAYGLSAEALWKMSVACALAAETIATATEQEASVAYTIGLLHGLGMVAIDEWAIRNAPDLRLKNAGLPLECTEAERKLFGFTQAEAAAALLRQWGFPPTMFEPVRWQYMPKNSSAHMKMSSLLVVAKWVRTSICGSAEIKPPIPDALVLKTLKLDEPALENIIVDVRARMSEVDDLLASANEDGTSRRRTTAPWGDQD